MPAVMPEGLDWICEADSQRFERFTKVFAGFRCFELQVCMRKFSSEEALRTSESIGVSLSKAPYEDRLLNLI